MASYVPIIVLTNVMLAFTFESPENCKWRLQGGNRNHIALDCSIRTINSDFDIFKFRSDQSEQITSVNVDCSDVLFFQSTLEPRVFQSLYHLQNLDIKFCKLNSLPAGTFLGLENMKSLTVRTHNSDWNVMALELTRDSLLGMPHLESLDLGENNLWNLPEHVLCTLPTLHHLNLTANRLQKVSQVGLVESCGTHLVTLDLSTNDLVYLPEAGFAGLQSLRELYFQNNKISTLHDGAFLGLSVLNILNISSNHILTLPPDLFNETTELKELYLHNNSLSVVAPGHFACLSHLTILDISDNQLTSEWVTADTFHGLVSLVVLSISHNRLTQVSFDMFKDLSGLQVLDLSHNYLSVIADKTFSSLANLHRLDLGFNHLLKVEAQTLSGLHVLSALSVAHNNISHIKDEAFDNCTNLRDIRLEYNSLSGIPGAIGKINSLKTLRISHNILGTIKQDDFTHLSGLLHLDMSNNVLNGICKQCLENLNELEVLDLSSNEFSAIPQGSFDSNIALQILRLDGNKLSDINGLFASLPNLIWLNVSDNRVTWFDYALIPAQLLYLDLNNNRIKDIGNYFNIESKLKLRTLDVSHNQLESLGPSSIPDSCELLFFNSNKITKLAPGTFSANINLSMIDLFDNLLSKIYLNSINIQLVPENKDLPEVYIGENPILCDCHMEWMHRVHQISGLRQHPRVMDLDKVTCTLPYPRSEENRVLFLETESSQFLCPYTSHCFALCKCCDFIACDCQMICPDGCSCHHDDTWATNIVDCSTRNHHQLLEDMPMDATVIYMDDNAMPILDAHHFIGRKNLQALYLNNSRIEKIQNRTFHGLSFLRELHLEDNVIIELEGFEFDQMTHLHELYLQNNHLKYINNATFSNLASLEIIRLDGNFLFDFPVWHLKLNPKLKTVTLSFNIWSCECQFMVDYKNWLRREKDIVRDSKSIYCVSNSTGEPGPYVLESSYSCETFMATSIVQEKVENYYLQPVLITLGTFFMLLVIVVMFAAFNSRFNTYFSEKCCLRCFKGAPKSLEINRNHILYDAFVSYSEIDAAFVNEIFAAELENGDPSYSVCLAPRDILAYQTIGTYVGDFIVESIKSSQKLILIITKNFIENDWCKFSFKAAHLEAIDNIRNHVIVVLCGDITENDMDPDLKSIVNISTKLKYEDKSFWSKLHASMPSDAHKMSNQCYITETNYVLRNSIPTFSQRQSPKQGVPLVPAMVLGQPAKTNHYHSHNTHRHLQHHQPSLDSSDLDKTFVSVETAQSSLGSTLAPTLNHSYMSIDYAQGRNSHIYASIDEPSSPPQMYPSALPSVHTLHQYLHQQQSHYPQQHIHQLSEDLLLLQQHQQQQCLQHTPISAPPGFADPSVSTSYFR
ncbi:unnamed protein product [Meganyctiphanes norvegica]|uniref:TIR domain-containing protein n=1 Tax=Meganyctiphanes norvegica TaxID=48144 RepID=A0AAV2SQL7_MEGNR